MELRNPDVVVSTSRPVVVFDFDGVMTTSPAPGSVPDIEFFHDLWNRPESTLINREMFFLLRTLRDSKWWRVAIITARPESFREQTVALLRIYGIPVDYVERITEIDRGVALFMRDFDPAGVDISDSGEWKLGVLDLLLSRGANISFVVEDYKRNADILRTRVPVLLYERVRAAGRQ